MGAYPSRGEAAIAVEPAASEITIDLTEAELETLPQEIFHKRRGRVVLKSRPRNIEALARRIARARRGDPEPVVTLPRSRARAIRRIR